MIIISYSGLCQSDSAVYAKHVFITGTSSVCLFATKQLQDSLAYKSFGFLPSFRERLNGNNTLNVHFVNLTPTKITIHALSKLGLQGFILSHKWIRTDIQSHSSLWSHSPINLAQYFWIVGGSWRNQPSSSWKRNVLFTLKRSDPTYTYIHTYLQ